MNRIFYLFILLAFSCFNAYADGSKDLYASGTGLRALLRSSNNVDAERWPFPNEGVHYVYAKGGEIIAMASNAVTYNSAKIELYNPQGDKISTLDFGTSSSNVNGFIKNRAAEQAGPKKSSTDNMINAYKPVEYVVPAGGEGIYMVKLLPPGTNGSSEGSTISAGSSSDFPTSASRVIHAWDVSVINSGRTNFIKGRVYVKLLNMSTGTSNYTNNGFYGIVYPLTKDGYTYRVDNNGNNGMYFTFLVNNNGFINSGGNPTYKSLNSVASSSVIHNPNLDDTNKQISHKIFYNPPTAATDLPASATGVVGVDRSTGKPIIGTTWLKNTVVAPNVSNISVVGIEGVPGQVSNKGGHVNFHAGTQGNYKISIKSPSNAFFERVLLGTASEGNNSIFWDGKAGNSTDATLPGIDVPVGGVPVIVTVQLQGAEVHFPFIDMEFNRLGIKIELLDHIALNNGTQTVVSDIVYWNDQDIPTASSSRGESVEPRNNSHLTSTYSPTVTHGDGNGISSGGHNGATPVNGHKWGQGSNSYENTFGDKKSIDTWTFIKGEEQTLKTNIVVKIADLKISNISHDKGTTQVKQGDIVVYTVKVKNGELGDGNSDVSGAAFGFTPPVGFVPDEDSMPEFTSSCGTQASAIVFNSTTGKYQSVLDLPNGCEITYTIPLKVSSTVTSGIKSAEATILRPNDVTDPDATNPDPTILPTNPHFECNPEGGPITCNNIKSFPITVAPGADLGVEKIVDNLAPHVGDNVIFTIKVTNYGPDAATSVVVTDKLPTGYTYISSIPSGSTTYAFGTGVWTVGALANGASATLTITAKVLPTGSYANTATVTSAVDDPTPENNSSTVNVVPCASPSGQVPLTGSTLTN